MSVLFLGRRRLLFVVPNPTTLLQNLTLSTLAAPAKKRRKSKGQNTAGEVGAEKELPNPATLGEEGKEEDSAPPPLHNLALRPYQRECIEICLEKHRSGVRRQAVSLPVAAGKTVIFSHLLSHVKDPIPGASKVLVLAHREELLTQAQKKISEINPRLRVDIEQADSHARPSADVVVASIPTIGRRSSNRLFKFDPKDFKMIIIDEAHHSAADSYLWTLEHFRALQPDSHIFLWGCSATLNRPDYRSLQPVFEEITFHRGINDLMEQDWLSEMAAYSIKTQVSLKGLSTSRTAGDQSDFVVSQLAKLIDVPERNKLIVDKWLELSAKENKQSTIVFAANVAHIEHFVEEFQSRGINAVGVHANTPKDERRQITQDFKDRRIPVLVNCGVFTEGVDIPNIDCVVMARPTKSQILFMQMLGRGLRKYPGKSSCLVLDFFDTFTGKNLMRIPTLFGLDPETPLKGESIIKVKKEQESKQKMKMDLELQAKLTSISKLEVFSTLSDIPRIDSRLNWKLVDNYLALSSWNLGQFYVGLKKGTTDRYCVIQHMSIPYTRKYLRGEFGSINEAVGFTDALLNSKLGFQKVQFLQRSQGWLQKPASSDQRKYLAKLGFKIPETEELSREKAQFLFLLKGAKAVTNNVDPIQENLTDISRALYKRMVQQRQMAAEVDEDQNL